MHRSSKIGRDSCTDQVRLENNNTVSFEVNNLKMLGGGSDANNDNGHLDTVPKRKRKSCAVTGCRTSGGRMINFPSNPKMREIWKSLCKINRPLKKYTYACSKHFFSHDFLSNGKLHKMLGFETFFAFFHT